MPDEPIPDDVRDFILQHIDSITHLEALLLLRANPGEPWDLAGAAKRLYADERTVEVVLARLVGDQLVSRDQDFYRFDPRPQERRATVDRLAAVYSNALIPVTNMIHAKERRIREFADAFRFRRDR